MKEVKHKTRLPSNCHDNIFLHSAQGKLKNLWRNQVGAQITEFLVALNSKSKQADILKMRLKKMQLKLNITTCILLIEPDVTVSNKIQNNHAYNVMRKAHDYLFKFQLLVESEEWEVQIIDPSVRNFVYQQALTMCKKDKELIIRKAAAFSIHARGRIPRWFTLLRNVIQNVHNLENYYITSAKPNNEKRDSDINEKKLINMQSFKMIKKSPLIDNIKKEFVYMQYDHMLEFGQIKKKHQTGRYTIQHWITADSEQSIDKATPYKVVQCYSDHTELRCINRVSNHQDNSDYKVIKDILEIRNHLDKQQILEYTPSYIQMPDYDTALIQNTLASNEAISQHITILHELRIIFNPSNTINIYTDGSLTDRFMLTLMTLQNIWRFGNDPSGHFGMALGRDLPGLLWNDPRR
ncbi:hypothetical protein GLOIN_2v1485023 [Rhizophagus clarus]|uniref:Reverse transcriptase domain-containing protein n=1 Tax=Rhizophagus clarus TaxID=94130 RepID=A0A8H3L1P1_9GLOM|nr:hypothetical protein GLOIN_2v1485023 [Rhizophagus clarus]